MDHRGFSLSFEKNLRKYTVTGHEYKITLCQSMGLRFLIKVEDEFFKKQERVYEINFTKGFQSQLFPSSDSAEDRSMRDIKNILFYEDDLELVKIDLNDKFRWKAKNL